MLNTIVTAILLGLLVMGVLHVLKFTPAASILNLLVSAFMLGLVIMVIMYLLRSV